MTDVGLEKSRKAGDAELRKKLADKGGRSFMMEVHHQHLATGLLLGVGEVTKIMKRSHEKMGMRGRYWALLTKVLENLNRGILTR